MSPIQKGMEGSNVAILWVIFEKTQDESAFAIEQGQKWANELGPDCEFIILSSSQFADAKTFLETIVSTIHLHRKAKNANTHQASAVQKIFGGKFVLAQTKKALEATQKRSSVKNCCGNPFKFHVPLHVISSEDQIISTSVASDK
ncbi:hypothetical protein KIN20_035378 [Parelaphostrongylus tenuis]|uniref:Uncharacterized protein n=1 Tax=Parelaphostrongylus tenuis TaxID=148309 RepID=A0AAD5RBG4_PARTN|nr:hypothetical protein KIN20_035378 [Parelaphostrongylus tenuis]